jgi:hypothetical protein
LIPSAVSFILCFPLLSLSPYSSEQFHIATVHNHIVNLTLARSYCWTVTSHNFTRNGGIISIDRGRHPKADQHRDSHEQQIQ